LIQSASSNKEEWEALGNDIESLLSAVHLAAKGIEEDDLEDGDDIVDGIHCLYQLSALSVPTDLYF
jgi:hypothetical protein